VGGAEEEKCRDERDSHEYALLAAESKRLLVLVRAESASAFRSGSVTGTAPNSSTPKLTRATLRYLIRRSRLRSKFLLSLARLHRPSPNGATSPPSLAHGSSRSRCVCILACQLTMPAPSPPVHAFTSAASAHKYDAWHQLPLPSAWPVLLGFMVRLSYQFSSQLTTPIELQRASTTYTRIPPSEEDCLAACVARCH
jgi:hypothetical protein